jgi:integrase
MLGYKADGKPNRRIVRGKTRREVTDKLDLLKTDFREGVLIAPQRQTVGEYLVGDPENFTKEEAVGGWLETHKRFGGKKGKGLRPNTYACYAGTIKNHILPEIGQVQLQRLTADHLERMYKAILAKKRRDGKNLSMRQAHLAHQVLNIALGAAFTKGIIKHNPCDRVPEKPHTSYKAEDRPRLVYSDVPRVLEEVKGTQYYIPFLLAMSAGLRRGEIIGLRWKNVDLDEGIIYVREQIQRGEDKKPTLDEVKTEAGNRDIPIPTDVVAALKEHRRTQKVLDLNGFVITNSRGGHLRMWDLDHKWGSIRKNLGLPQEMTLHDLRGSWVTWLAEAKVDMKAASQLMGHSDERTTRRLYQSVTKDMKRDAARALEGITKSTVAK